MFPKLSLLLLFCFVACLSAGVAQESTNDNSADILRLQRQMRNQHNVLEEKLDLILSELASAANETEADDSTSPTAAGGVGVTYKRWGRTTCPDTASLVYEGVMANSYFNAGGGANYLCLPLDPDFPEGATANHQSNSHIYGVEYESPRAPLMDASLNNQDAPCVVCEAVTRSQLLMIPAKLSCPAGWTQEYEGLLMSLHHTQGKAEFICVSSGMEATSSGQSDRNGGLLYVVEAVCGSLPCPPYTSGFEMGCVVCTK